MNDSCAHRNFWGMNGTNQVPGNYLVALSFFIAATLALFPFWITELPAAIDLPQHLAQVRLLDETIAGHRQDLVVTPWYYPNTLVYWVLYGLWKIFPPLTAGRLMLSMLAALWIAGALALQHQHRRPITNWLIATPIVFNFLFNWGLLNFLIGWPVFCVFLLTVGARPFKGKELLVAATALLLYFSHSLWFAMANVWLLAMLINTTPAQRIRLGCAMLPGWALALLWYPKLSSSRQDSGVDTSIEWGAMPLERLDFSKLSNAAFGSLNGDIESFALTALLLWIVLIVVTRWRKFETESDLPMLTAAVLMILGYWVLPEKYMNTIFFNQRWLPCGMTLLLLALPAPNLRRAIPFVTGIGLLGLLSITTAKAWRDWEEEHLPGFVEALACIDATDKVLALNLNDGSMHLKGRPGLQLFAYAQALRNADIYFSFTEHYSGAVQFRTTPSPNPERKLVWLPGNATEGNVTGYTKVVINGNDVMQRHFARKLKLLPVDQSSDRLWRVYRPSCASTCR